jgi:NAD(P)H-hydrate epimerase
VTLAFPKIGLYLFPGAALVGELEVGSIGLPEDMAIPSGMELLDAPLIRPSLPVRLLESNKGTYGKAMILAGSPQYIGAAVLAASAAGRIGAGLITIATTRELSHVYASSLVEATYCLLPPLDAKPQERARVLLDALRGYRALVVGPGLGQSDATREFLLRVFDGVRAMPESERPRLTVDADGLNNLSHVERWHERLPAGTVLTPHPGEMARLRAGAPVSGGGADRLSVVSECARAWGHVVVLKGAATLIASPDGALRLNWPGNPALASAGTGDVLAGTIGGLLAQGMAPFEAASAGVYLHSRAGLLVSARLGDAGLLASDLLSALPEALRATKDG